MFSHSTHDREESFLQLSVTDAVSSDELSDFLVFNDTIDDLLASGELNVEDLPFNEPRISEESIAFLNAQVAETTAKIARGEVELDNSDPF